MRTAKRLGTQSTPKSTQKNTKHSLMPKLPAILRSTKRNSMKIKSNVLVEENEVHLVSSRQVDDVLDVKYKTRITNLSTPCDYSLILKIEPDLLHGFGFNILRQESGRVVFSSFDDSDILNSHVIDLYNRVRSVNGRNVEEMTDLELFHCTQCLEQPIIVHVNLVRYFERQGTRKSAVLTRAGRCEERYSKKPLGF